MSACSFITAKGTPCKGKAWSGRAYCSKHEPKPAGEPEPESEEVESPAEPEARRPGQARERPAGAPIDPRALLENQRERQREQAEWLASGADEEPVVPMDQVAAQLAVIMHEHELKEMDRARRRGAPRRDRDGYRLDDGEPARREMPVKMLTRRRGPDPTRIVDPITKRTPASLRPDWVQEWVAMTDGEGRPTEHRIAELEGYGYEFIPDCEDRPITGRLGVAMQGPPEAKASHVLAHTRTGALRTRDDSLAAADDYAQAINRRAGDEVVSIVRDRDHGERQTSVPLGKEHLYDV